MIGRDDQFSTKSAKETSLINLKLVDRERVSRRASHIPSGQSYRPDGTKPQAIGPSLTNVPLSDMNCDRRSTSAIRVNCISNALPARNENNLRAVSSSMMRMPADNPLRERRSSSVTIRRSSTTFNASSVTDASRPLLFGSRAPEVIIKKKKLYNTQVTSVSTVIYDENWASKQTKSYTDCLNQMFLSSLGSLSASGEMDVTAGHSNRSDGEAILVRTAEATVFCLTPFYLSSILDILISCYSRIF